MDDAKDLYPLSGGETTHERLYFPNKPKKRYGHENTSPSYIQDILTKYNRTMGCQQLSYKWGVSRTYTYRVIRMLKEEGAIIPSKPINRFARASHNRTRRSIEIIKSFHPEFFDQRKIGAVIDFGGSQVVVLTPEEAKKLQKDLHFVPVPVFKKYRDKEPRYNSDFPRLTAKRYVEKRGKWKRKKNDQSQV